MAHGWVEVALCVGTSTTAATVRSVMTICSVLGNTRFTVTLFTQASRSRFCSMAPASTRRSVVPEGTPAKASISVVVRCSTPSTCTSSILNASEKYRTAAPTASVSTTAASMARRTTWRR